MTIETLIENHTKALEALTAAILKINGVSSIAVSIQDAYAKANGQKEVPVEVPVVEVAKTVVAPVKKPKKVDVEAAPEAPTTLAVELEYGDVRQLVNDKAPSKGKQIRALFDLHGITNLRDLLNDREDMESGVKDVQKLTDIYEALKVL